MRKELSILLEVIEEAGAAILQLQQTNFSINKKSNGDIVTQADWIANDILQGRLSKAFPEYGWLSEESVDDSARLDCECVWVVDPIDGTREYAANRADYAISVALVENGKPVLAAVFNPAHQELFYASKGEGAHLDKTRLRCLAISQESMIFLASRSEYFRGEWERFSGTAHKIQTVGSIAYKMALVAAGKAHATWSLGPKNEWDIAAGTLLVSEAGGVVTTKTQNPIAFNQKNVKVDSIVACDQSSYSYICRMLG